MPKQRNRTLGAFVAVAAALLLVAALLEPGTGSVFDRGLPTALSPRPEQSDGSPQRPETDRSGDPPDRTALVPEPAMQDGRGGVDDLLNSDKLPQGIGSFAPSEVATVRKELMDRYLELHASAVSERFENGWGRKIPHSVRVPGVLYATRYHFDSQGHAINGLTVDLPEQDYPELYNAKALIEEIDHATGEFDRKVSERLERRFANDQSGEPTRKVFLGEHQVSH